VAAKTVKSSGKRAKQGAKARGAAQPVRKAAAKPAKKAGAPAGKKSAKPAAKKGVSRKVSPKPAAAKKPVARKATAKPAAKRPAAVKAAPPAKAKAGAKPKAHSAKPVAAAPPLAPRHPKRPEAPPAKTLDKAKPGSATTAPAAMAPRPIASVRPQPAVKRPFSRESVRVGESRFAQPAGARPVFPAMYQKDLKSGQESNDSPTEDLVDRANNAYTRELAFSISDSERELMHQIDLAIERLKAGSYGFCLHTGQQIGQARLEAIPWAKYSVEAQELLEKGLLSEA
jgi:RNA polymerase-binding protein DksA